MASFLYIIDQPWDEATQVKYVVRKVHNYDVNGIHSGPARIAYMSSGIINLEEGKDPVWGKNRWPHKPVPSNKEITLMLLKARA